MMDVSLSCSMLWRHMREEEVMALTEFLDGSAPDNRGRYISEIYSLNDQEIESTHDFIQWIFPLRDASRAVFNAPVLSEDEVREIQGNQIAQENLAKFAEWYLGFLKRNKYWVARYDHNHLRITRAIKSIRLLVGDREADALRNQIFETLGDARSQIDPKAVSFWMDA